MLIVDESITAADLGPTAVTIGAFDGVHLGHQGLIDRLATVADKLDATSVAVTFDRHPAEIVRPASAPKLLCSLDHKLELLSATGVDAVLVVNFDETRAMERAEDFAQEVLVERLGARYVMVGADFHFGHRRLGNVGLLRELGPAGGFEVEGIELIDEGVAVSHGPETLDGADTSVSSTAVRQALLSGELATANRMLGRPHEMRGPVVQGDRRGRTIGFPTANVAISDRILMPADGIYAGHLVDRDTERRFPAAIYIGSRPTFYEDGAATLLEVHCLDEPGDLYGHRVGVTFEERVRADQRFDSVEALQAQLEQDCAAARKALR